MFTMSNAVFRNSFRTCEERSLELEVQLPTIDGNAEVGRVREKKKRVRRTKMRARKKAG